MTPRLPVNFSHLSWTKTAGSNLSHVHIWNGTERVCESHITSHLLCWASAGGATNSPPHVLYLRISYSCGRAHETLNSPQPINSLCPLHGQAFHTGNTVLKEDIKLTHSINQPINQSINQSIYQSISHSSSQLASHSVYKFWLIHAVGNRSVNWAVDWTAKTSDTMWSSFL